MNTNEPKSYFESLASRFHGTIEFGAVLSRFTHYRIGGPADVVMSPKDLDDLSLIHEGVIQLGMPFFILGWGSNLLFSDEGYRGVVIRMKQLFTRIDEEGDLLWVGASVGGSTLLRRAQQQGYGGLSFLTGIPGSLGGMVAMNAGTHQGEIKDCCVEVESVSLAAPQFEVTTRKTVTDDFSYRRNHFLKSDEVVTRVQLKYQPTDPNQIRKEIDHLYRRRKETQPVDLPSCGSVFMNPKEAGLQAWQVIDRLGLRGLRVGDAQISEKHGNFIVNLGQAKAAEVTTLIELVKRRAKDELGIEMREEVRIVK